MSQSSTTISDESYLASELACYLQSAAISVTLPAIQTAGQKYDAGQYLYQLPAGKLQLLALTLYLPLDTSSADISAARMTAVKSALAWHKASASQNKSTERNDIEKNRTESIDTNNKDIEPLCHDVLVVDIQLTDDEERSAAHTDSHQTKPPSRLKHDFGARYFLEDLVVDMSEAGPQLHVFSWHDWQSVLVAVQTPCELWRFLSYHLAQLQYSAISHAPSFVSEEVLAAQFLQSPSLLAPAITVDNTLIKHETQDKPNPALVTMALAYKNQSATAQMYHQHMQQAATLWSQLSAQMIAMYREKQTATDDQTQPDTLVSRWQQQLLDESLFSRHELVRTLYRHPKQSDKLRQDGYVVHQHSYESLGRHYVLIFYGQDAQANNSKAAIQPNLAKIAQDVATRLPIVELHHIVVLGIDFITEDNETFIDIDVWIQPVDTMTQRERQLTKQIQQLKKQESQKNAQRVNRQADQNAKYEDKSENNNKPAKLPQVKLSLSIPAKKDR
ncbi:hypothetical protein ACTXGL_10770 [Psychrobacter sp. T6-6]|uniref:hypothetical protein n=1 Tax=Psychrobacter sp. T6-6 TaxID=3457452 RepID=UPI003FD5DC3A